MTTPFARRMLTECSRPLLGVALGVNGGLTGVGPGTTVPLAGSMTAAWGSSATSVKTPTNTGFLRSEQCRSCWYSTLEVLLQPDGTAV